MLRSVRVVLVLLLVLVQSVHAQEGIKTFDRFRVLLTNGERYEGRDGRLTQSSLEGTMKGGEATTIPRGEIRALDVSGGSKTGLYAAIGSGIGLLTGLTAALAAWSASEDDPALEFKSGTAVALTVGLTVGGGLIGAAFGASQVKWERVPIETSLFFDRRSGQNICMIGIPF